MHVSKTLTTLRKTMHVLLRSIKKVNSIWLLCCFIVFRDCDRDEDIDHDRKYDQKKRMDRSRGRQSHIGGHNPHRQRSRSGERRDYDSRSEQDNKGKQCMYYIPCITGSTSLIVVKPNVEIVSLCDIISSKLKVCQYQYSNN